jgi:cell division protein FtsB
MRLLTFALVALLALVHLDLWFGRSGVGRVMELRTQVADLQTKNDQARVDNERLLAEVSDLKQGLEIIEEKARFELGMIKPGEVLVQIAPRR